jgi:hypothetical protein
MRYLRPSFIFILAILCVGVLSFVLVSAENSAFACEPDPNNEIIIKSAKTYLDSGPSPYLSAYIKNTETICWSINNAYPGEIAYLLVTYKNISKKSISTDSFTFLKPNELSSLVTINHSKKIIKPGDTGDCIVKMNINNCMQTRTYPCEIKLWFYR